MDGSDRVIGCGGYSRIEGTKEAYIRRLYIKASDKHKIIGSALLDAIEAGMRAGGVAVAGVHLGTPPEQLHESYSFYPKHGYEPRFIMREFWNGFRCPTAIAGKDWANISCLSCCGE